ncbi:MAG: RNA methyltransferase [Deltaproteobacteria bacterium]|jgi:23S rRNA (guanosine2251-2'-O)-methyltransferase|nr:RNA methyltransferase [Deltaproteobacteria bacterium]
MNTPRFPKPAARRAQAGQDEIAPEADQARSPSETSFLLPGIKPVLEMLETAPERLDSVFLRKGRHVADLDRLADNCRRAGVRFFLLEAKRFARLYPGANQGVVARLYESGFTDLKDLLSAVMDAPLPLLLFLDQVQDPGNAGALARTLYALGGAGLVIPRHNGVYLGAGAVRASAGALARLPVAKAPNLGQALDKAADLGFTLYASAALPETAPSGLPVQNVFAFTPRLPAALILGAEGEGLRPGIRKRCHCLLTIPLLRPFDSLNVAQAGAIILGRFSSLVPGGPSLQNRC